MELGFVGQVTPAGPGNLAQQESLQIVPMLLMA